MSEGERKKMEEFKFVVQSQLVLGQSEGGCEAPVQSAERDEILT